MSQTINIHFTASALTYIKQVLEKNQAAGFRLSVKKTGCSGFSYLPEAVKNFEANDIQIQLDNITILIDPKWFGFFEGLTIDFVEEEKSGLKQKRLVFSNPNENSRCGCGESFHIGPGDDGA